LRALDGGTAVEARLRSGVVEDGQGTDGQWANGRGEKRR